MDFTVRVLHHPVLDPESDMNTVYSIQENPENLCSELSDSHIHEEWA